MSGPDNLRQNPAQLPETGEQTCCAAGFDQLRQLRKGRRHVTSFPATPSTVRSATVGRHWTVARNQPCDRDAHHLPQSRHHEIRPANDGLEPSSTKTRSCDMTKKNSQENGTFADGRWRASRRRWSHVPRQVAQTAPHRLRPLEGTELHTWRPTGEVMSHSVTTILRAGKDPKTLQIFEDTKHIWAPRGTHVHSCLEQFLRGTPMDDLLGGPYDEWVRPLLEYPLWETFEPIALEYNVCDLRRNIGGSLDVLGWDHLLDVMVLLDLKTLGRFSRTLQHPCPAGRLPVDADRSPQAGGGRMPDDVGRSWRGAPGGPAEPD